MKCIFQPTKICIDRRYEDESIKLWRVLCCRFEWKHTHTHTYVGNHPERKTESARKSCIQLCMQNAMEEKKTKRTKRLHSIALINRFSCWKHFRSILFPSDDPFFLTVWRLFHCLFNLIPIVVQRILVCIYETSGAITFNST